MKANSTTVPTAASDPDFSLTLRRNCSASPGDFLWLLALVMLLPFGAGIGFALAGAWMVLPFAGLEAIALVAAFCAYSRHACDYEHIAVCAGKLIVEIREGEEIRRSELNAAWVRIAERESACEYRLALLAHGREIVVGRHLDTGRRRRLAAVLRKEVSRFEGEP